MKKLVVWRVVAVAVAGALAPAADGQEPAPATLEATVWEAASGAVVAQAGPWSWSDGLWYVEGLPEAVPLTLRLLVRDPEGAPILIGLLPLFEIAGGMGGLGGPEAGLLLLPEGEGIRVLSAPVMDFGLVTLLPYVEVVPLAVDIKPGSARNPLNVKSRGVLPVAVAGSEDLGAELLAGLLFTLADVEPLRMAVEDVMGPDGSGPDGVADLVLHFDTRQVVAALPVVEDGAEVVLTLETVLPDGAFAAGEDVVTLLVPGGKR